MSKALREIASLVGQFRIGGQRSPSGAKFFVLIQYIPKKTAKKYKEIVRPTPRELVKSQILHCSLSPTEITKKIWIMSLSPDLYLSIAILMEINIGLMGCTGSR